MNKTQEKIFRNVISEPVGRKVILQWLKNEEVPSTCEQLFKQMNLVGPFTITSASQQHFLFGIISLETADKKQFNLEFYSSTTDMAPEIVVYEKGSYFKYRAYRIQKRLPETELICVSNRGF